MLSGTVEWNSLRRQVEFHEQLQEAAALATADGGAGDGARTDLPVLIDVRLCRSYLPPHPTQRTRLATRVRVAVRFAARVPAPCVRSSSHHKAQTLTETHAATRTHTRHAH